MKKWSTGLFFLLIFCDSLKGAAFLRLPASSTVEAIKEIELVAEPSLLLTSEKWSELFEPLEQVEEIHSGEFEGHLSPQLEAGVHSAGSQEPLENL